MPDQYAYAADFDTSAGELPAPDETRMNALLKMASDLVDLARGVAPGHWGPIDTPTTYTFDACGEALLRLRDEGMIQYLLRSVVADKIEVDENLDGTYEHTLDLADAWVEGYPRNAGVFTALRLIPRPGATPTAWRGRVRVTGAWGHATVPVAVKQRVIDIAHALSQRGYAGELADQALQQGEAPAWVMKLVDSLYNHRLPAIA